MIELRSIEGLKELDRALKRFPKELQQKLLNNATRAGARLVAKTASDNAPVEHGYLKNEITVRKKKSRVRYESNYNVVLRRDGFYGWILEIGAEPHEIKPKKKDGLLVWGGWEKTSSRSGAMMHTGDSGAARKVKHPGITPNPWITRAYDESTDVVMEKFKQNLRSGIARVVKSL